jgi:hypothetical protein
VVLALGAAAAGCRHRLRRPAQQALDVGGGLGGRCRGSRCRNRRLHAHGSGHAAELGGVLRFFAQLSQGSEDRHPGEQRVGVEVLQRGKGQFQALIVELQHQPRRHASQHAVEGVDVQRQRLARGQWCLPVAAQVGQQQQAQGCVVVAALAARTGGLQGHVELHAGGGHGNAPDVSS